MGFLSDIARQVGPLDLLDMGLVALVIYGILSWMRGSIPESALRRIFVAAPAAAAIYILVRVFDLYLLETVVRVLFIVFVIAAVVVFQSDIRRMFDRIVTSRVLRRESPTGETSTYDVLTEAATKMADLKMGALIAVKGREPLDTHIHGGIDLGGRITQPLLLGIFHPETPGHDGAVIVDGDRVARVAAHLPLSPDLPDVSRYGGTRHAAALGLAQESDALVIVVSEERGTIGVARDGELDPDVDVSELKKHLEDFWSKHYRRGVPARLVWWRRPNLRTAFFAVLLSVLTWLVVVYSPNTVIRTLAVPVEILNLPDGWVLNGELPSEARVVLSGSEQVFRRLNTSEVAISIDASQPESGVQEIVVTESDLDLPAGINLNDVDPKVLRMHVRRLRAVRVPVRVQTTGRLRNGLTLSGLDAEPDSVTVMIPEDDASPLRAVPAQPIDLAAVEGDSDVTRRLILPEGASMPAGAPGEVEIHIDVSRSEPRPSSQ